MPSTGRRRDLTKRTIKALRPRKAAQFVAWDGDVRGFGVRVSPAGAKTFILKYRLPSGRVRWATLGRIETLSVEKARDKARRMRGTVADGQDPQAVYDAAKDVITVADVCTRFLLEHAPRKKPSTQRMYHGAIDNHIRPRLGTVPIGEVTDDHVIRLHHRLRATPTHANRTAAVLSKVLAWAVKAKLRPAGPNPCQGIEKYPETERTRHLTAVEYARLGRALRTARRTATIAPAPLTAIEILLVTGARPAEIATLQWAHVDLPGRTLRLPDSKTGAKSIYLSPDAVRLLQRWPQWAGSPYVFPGNGRGTSKGEHLHPSTLTHAWETLRKTAGLEDCRLYDACRHSFASVAVSDHNLSLAQIGEQLGHSQAATTKRYTHLHDAVAKQNAANIGGTIAAALKRRRR